MSRLFDVHAHYTDKRFDTEYPGGADALLTKLFSEDVGHIVNIATNINNAREVIAQCARFEGMYGAVGIHPTDVDPAADFEDEMNALCEMLDEAEKNKIVSVGEIGFDYYWQPYDPDLQRKYFAAQMEIAEKYGLPVEIHDRDAHGDSFDMIRQYPRVRGILHSFSGSPELALEIVKRGWYISFSGVVTFKNARKLPDVAKVVPLDRILIETDCPYLAPHPHRGETNHSGLMLHTAEKIAELRGVTTEEIISVSEKNAAELFEISL